MTSEFGRFRHEPGESLIQVLIASSTYPLLGILNLRDELKVLENVECIRWIMG